MSSIDRFNALFFIYSYAIELHSLKKHYVILFFAVLLSFSLKASHLMGGDITWVCLGNGQYKFTMRVYRDCNGVQMTLPVALSVWNHPSVTSIAMNLVSQIDISPQCNGSGPTIN